MGKTVKMSDIAQILNVSNVTVSKALANKDGVGEELRTKIKQVAIELGYRYNSAAKSLKDGRTYNIGILIPQRFVDVKTSFYWEMYQNVSSALLNHNYYGILEILRPEDEDENNLPKMIQDNKVDGIIVLGQIKEGYVEAITAVYKSLIFLDFYDKHSNIDTVITDNFYGMYLLTDYLIEKGHRDIAFVGNNRATSSIQDRYLGYLKALLENDIPYNHDWLIVDRELNGKYIDIKLPSHMPTAFVCNCDEVAYRVIKEIKRNGLMVPRDISVVGFDNYLISDICEPAITTVEVDMKTMAESAVETLVRKINDMEYKPGRQLISGKIVIKNSVRQIN